MTLVFCNSLTVQIFKHLLVLRVDKSLSYMIRFSFNFALATRNWLSSPFRNKDLQTQQQYISFSFRSQGSDIITLQARDCVK